MRRQRDPALVEWMGYGLLRARIFPINPGEEKRVVLRFQVIAPREGDAIRVDYQRGSGRTLVASGTDTHDARESSFTLRYPKNGRCNAYSPTQELQSRSSSGSECVVDVGGEGAAVTILIPAPRTDRAAISVLANAPGSEDGFALITLTPPSRETATVPRDITFVLNVSGSMSGRKIEQARAAGKQLLGTLTRDDRFRMIDFSSDVRTFRDDFVDATPANISAATRYLSELQANGGTNIDGALDLALAPPRSREGDDNEYAHRSARGAAGRLSLVLFVTDGEPTIGERDPAAIAAHAARLRGSQRVFTFGLGADVNAQLIEQLALEGHGTAQFVRPDEDVERAVGLVASRLTSPIASDLRVTVQCGGNDEGECVHLVHALPEGPIDLFAGQDLVLLSRYSGSGRARLAFDGRSATGAVHWETMVDFPDHERDNAFVPRLWATRRIGWLSAARRQNGASPEVDDELRTLGERYGIPTELTSYLVQEQQVATNGGRPLVDSNISGPLAAPAAKFEAARAATEQRDAKSIGCDGQAHDAARGRGRAKRRPRQLGGKGSCGRTQTCRQSHLRASQQPVDRCQLQTGYEDREDQAIFAGVLRGARCDSGSASGVCGRRHGARVRKAHRGRGQPRWRRYARRCGAALTQGAVVTTCTTSTASSVLTTRCSCGI